LQPPHTAIGNPGDCRCRPSGGGFLRDAREAYRLAAAPDLTAAILDYNLGANTSVLVGWRLHSCGVPFLFYTGRFDLPALPWPTVPVVHKPSPMIRIVSALASLITCRT